MKKDRGPAIFLLTIFVINFLSLVYQVVWTRRIMVIFGTTALSISTILTVFLSGIAIGGYVGSKLIKKIEKKYRFCGYSLIALGAYCLVSLYLFSFVKYPFHYLVAVTENPLLINLFKLVLSFIILIFPTTIIGMMFPVVTYLYSVEFKRLGRDVASLYFLDTFGAALGATICGFFLVPVAGLSATSLISGLIYIILGFFIAGLEKDYGGAFKEEVKANPGPVQKTSLDGTRVLVLAALFASGFAALTLEVVWSRYFHLIFGTSIYAFSLVLAAFLLGLSAGSIVIHRYLDRLKNPLLVFAYIEILIAGFSFFILHTSEWMEKLYFQLFYSTGNFYVFQSVLFIAAFILMIVPTSLMGANFPLAVKIFSRNKDTRGEDVGLTFSVNTAGGIIGAFAAGFLIIPVLGLKNSSVLASAIYFAVGFIFILMAQRRLALHATMAACFTAAFLAFGYLKGGEPSLDNSIYYIGVRYKDLNEYLDFKKREKILYSRHGYYGLVTVAYDPEVDVYYLRNNGKTDASTQAEDIMTQSLLGHIPLFLHPAPKSALNIGLGGGFTLGAITAHPEVEHVDAVEIDPLVVETAQSWFAPYNNNALKDPRVKMHVQDGRHFLETTSNRYDVIVSEPPNMWVSGVSQLFTREFYRIVDEHLNEGGILSQWVPYYELEEGDLKLILRTIRERFEYVAFWSNGLDVVITASHSKPEINPDRVQTLMTVAAVEREMQRIRPGINSASVAGFLSKPNMDFSKMDDYLTEIKEINTDNLPILEFKTARNSYNKIHALSK